MARTNNTVPKVITNALGHQQTVHVNPNKGASVDPKVQERLTKVPGPQNWGVVPKQKRSPWGDVTDQDTLDDGIAAVSVDGYETSRAYKLSKKRNDAVHEEFRQPEGWYDADKEGSIVVTTFPEAFDETEVEHAQSHLRVNYWRQYEAMTGEVVPEDESYVKQIENFAAANRENYVSTGENVRKSPLWRDHLIVESKRASDGTTAHYLIPTEEYRDAKYAQLVIDPERHLDANAKSEEWPIPPNELAQRNEMESFAFQWADQVAGLDGFETNDERNYFAHWVATDAAWDDTDHELVPPSREQVMNEWRENHKEIIAKAEEQSRVDAARRQREDDAEMQGFWEDSEG